MFGIWPAYVVPMGTRRLSIGCDFRYSAAVPTPAVVQVTPLGGEGVSIDVEQWYLEPAQDRTHEYRDLYGNRCQRMVLPAGSSRIGYQALVTVPDAALLGFGTGALAATTELFRALRR